MTVTQDTAKTPISTTVSYVNQKDGQVLKTLNIESSENYLETVNKIVDDMHGDFIISSRTNNPLSLRKWPKRFKKYSKKKKHKKVSMKGKERKQLAANIAK